MEKIAVNKLAEIIGAEGDVTKGLHCGGVSTDSRTVRAGDCFFAIRGKNFDGHDYVNQAIEKGAARAVVSRNIGVGRLGDKVLKVEDTIAALGRLAAWYRQKLNCRLIAITGSVGKTTTRELIYHVLSRHFKCHQSAKNYNNNIGLPLTILGADGGHEIIIAELGTNHPGEIACLTKIARPDAAVITNVHAAHLEGFDSIQAVAEEKISIAQGLREGGRLFINRDQEILVNLARKRGIAFTGFGRSAPAGDVRYTPEGGYFRTKNADIFVPLPGPGNLDNALAAFAVCRNFGVGAVEFADDVKSFGGCEMRTEVLRMAGVVIINDCYNANPASMKNALEILRMLSKEQNRRSLFICGEMAELGRHAAALHQQLGENIGRLGVQVVIGIGPMANIAAQQASKINSRLRLWSFTDTVSACNGLSEIVENDDIILVKGSRSARLEVVTEKLKQIFE